MMLHLKPAATSLGSKSDIANLRRSPSALPMLVGLFIWSLLSSGCAALPGSKPIPPTVKVSDVNIVKLGISTMELAFTLDVFNPNNYDLPINTLEFVASTDEQVVANGQSNEPVVLSPGGSTPLVVNVSAKTSRLLSKLMAASRSPDSTLDYNVTGFVKLDNWPSRIPFNVDRSLALD